MEQISLASVMKNMEVLQYDAIVVGTGCAGYQTADCLVNCGVRHIAILSEGIKMGTSRNTGSDKQTYYKLSLGGNAMDSVRTLAEDLFAGGGVNGDIALVEASYSARCFFRLLELGVPFPCNDYGEYIGYQTDHDIRSRATSCGPLTSRYMTEALERSCQAKNIPVLDHMQVVAILIQEETVCGVIAINTKSGVFTSVISPNVILATGGPAGVYERSVYPKSQTGMTGMALAAGAKAVNLQEWQYGLASIAFRWNVSGSYQQVLPRYVSVDHDGVEHEFLQDAIHDTNQMLRSSFLKGYEWPIDVRKLQGSSQIDLLVYHEIIQKKRRVFLDFRRNPSGLNEDLSNLPDEAKEYYIACDAMRSRPIERLAAMNPDAIDLYKRHGIDLHRDMLEISVCAQHCNGGLDVDANWQTNIQGLYAVGEAAGTFGVYRPGGAALNSTQVGGMRAAEHIAASAPGNITKKACMPIIEQEMSFILNLLQGGEPVAREKLYAVRHELQKEMSDFAAFLRDVDKWDDMIQKRKTFLREPMETSTSPALWPYVLRTHDIVQTQLSILSAMQKAQIFGSRGAAVLLHNSQMLPQVENAKNVQIITCLSDNNATSFERPVRRIPNTGANFESMWKTFQKNAHQAKKKAE